MKVLLVTGAAIVITCVVSGPTASTRAAPMAAEPRPAAQAQLADFKRPEVAPLPAEGKFQVVSAAAWPSDQVRVFFLGAQF